MATSIVEICNAALSLIGEKQITNATLSSNTEAERQCSLMFPIIRDKVLREHPWNFAESRATLAALVETPAFEFDYYYQLPSDCLRVLRLYETDENFRVEANRRLATDATPCQLIYTAKVTDPAQFDSGYTHAVIYHLAAHLAMVLSDNRTLAAELRQAASNETKMAKVFDAQESYPYKRKNKDSWVSFRRGRGSVGPNWNGW